MYKIGDTISDFALKDDKGQTVRLSQFRGKVTVLMFYASWCPGCNEEAPHLEKEIWQKYKDKKVQVVGVALQEGDGPFAKMRKFRKDHKLTYPLVLDDPGNIIQKFGFSGIPQGVVIDPKGKYVAESDSVAGLSTSLRKLVK